MRKALIILLILCLGVSNAADFIIEQVDVTVSDIKSDGSAKVHESIKLIMYGDYAISVYDSGISKNDLSFWSTGTSLKDVKFHVNPSKVDIRDLRLRPQPRTKCNPIQGICHGELILDYTAYPSYANESVSEPVSGTGIFNIERYKPRTRRYTLNPSAISFTTTADGNTILDDKEYLHISLPQDSVMLDLNPQPSGLNIKLPSHVEDLSYNDIVLVKFSVVFDVEEGIDKEVTEFFTNITNSIFKSLSGPYGYAMVLLIIIVIGSYIYITISKRRGED